MTYTPLDLRVSLLLILFAIGLAAVITGSEAGYPIRFIGCFLLKKLRLKFLWPLVQCPHCCTFWAGIAVSFMSGASLLQALQIAFSAAGIVMILQEALGSPGIAAAEDFESILESKQERGE